MSILRKLEKTLDDLVRSPFASRPRPEVDREGAEAIELYREAIERIASRAVPGKRGDRLFPYDKVRIELRAPDAERRAVLETIFEPGQLLEDVKSALREERVETPAGLAVTMECREDLEGEMRVLFEKTPVSPAEVPEAAPEAPAEPVNVVFERTPVVLTTLTGAASEPEFRLDRSRLHIGREREVPDANGKTLRHNELCFPEGGHEANLTVSRTHAHLRFHERSGEWRIYDDGSTFGTAVYRDGNRIEVPPHASRGVLLKPGDEVHLGQVRVRFEEIRS